MVCDCLLRLRCVAADFAVPICFEREIGMDGNNSLFCLFAAPDSQFLRFCLGIDRNFLDPAGESSIGDEKSGGDLRCR